MLSALRGFLVVCLIVVSSYCYSVIQKKSDEVEREYKITRTELRTVKSDFGQLKKECKSLHDKLKLNPKSEYMGDLLNDIQNIKDGCDVCKKNFAPVSFGFKVAKDPAARRSARRLLSAYCLKPKLKPYLPSFLYSML